MALTLAASPPRGGSWCPKSVSNARALSFKRCRSSQAAPLTRNVLVRAQRRFAKMSLLFLDHFRKRPPAPDFQETVKAPRVLFDFVAKRARSYRAYRA